MDLASRFKCWRALKGPGNSRGLAWFLAAEFARRFYASHGLVPWVIAREGVGYYGIEINHVRCAVHAGSAKPLGRFTMCGDVENWRRGDPGDHGLALSALCERGVPTTELVSAAVAHFEETPFPTNSHLSCRHKRWGDSYVLVFEVAAYLALQYESETLKIWNNPEQLDRRLRTHDRKASMKEHPGGFLFTRGDRDLLIAGDGRVLDNTGDNLWRDYMQGQGIPELATAIDGRLGA